jgi:hypothetical protein
LENEKTDINYLKQTFQVIHLKNRNKRTISGKHNIEETQVCGVFDKFGNRVEKNGHCSSCNNCNHSYIKHIKGEKAMLPIALCK